ncbi:EamA family transporter RarD [Ornithinimicrobium cerasi]|uniref:Chloramphenicol-sensitive protein RarD n=1 Tax=Ornithinimicrobium cerasi TaxID=2248773 RepID=A0A285VP94_9MICO|nr:EamA family transporter RarD [Ornithinimicrobium cerasi]SOC55904.1 chloramphenicol-sensitive protein RarD [Ornithinimicrobium cerasi]
MTEAARRQQGTVYGFLAYLLWGAFPLYFHLLRPAGPWEILAHRIVWTLLLCGLLLLLLRDVRWLGRLVRRPRRLGGVALAGALIATNWGIYTWAVLSGHVTEAALGYFLNPLVTVALGVVILGERLRRLQWTAVVIGTVAAVYLTFDYGAPPWVSLALAFSFATYSLLKNRLGVSLTPLQSLTGESLVILPVAVVILLWLDRTGGTTFGGHGALHTALLVSTGVATAVPLILFAAAASRVPLSTIGLLQFLTPFLQLLTGVLLLGEVVPATRWVGFAMVWVALVVLSVDMVRQVRRSRRTRRDLVHPAP